MAVETNHTAPPRARMHPRDVLWLVGRLFRPNLSIDVVTTKAMFDAPPDDVWQRMMFYEEIPQRPSLLLRILLPTPVRTQGSKEVGTVVACIYSRGGLTKRITVLERPRLVRFEVLEQHLGVERCMTTVEGSYEFRAEGPGTRVTLTTQYHGHLRPRRLWRPLERLLAHQLHRHILDGMGALPGG